MGETDTILKLIFGLLGGLALFIFGIRTMSHGLTVAVKGRGETDLRIWTSG